MEVALAALCRAWAAHPLRGLAGVLGLGLVVWSLLPVATTARTGGLRRGRARTRLASLARFLADVQESWRTRPARAVVGTIGAVLFVWSALPITTMR
jgi:hypothetical protein